MADSLEDAIDGLGATALRIKAERDALAAALKPFADAYRKNYDPGVSDLDNEQPVSWHVPLGAYRRALSLTAPACLAPARSSAS